MSNAPGRTDWAEDDEPDLASAIPPPQITKNKDGSETIVTIFLNDEGKRVKRTQRIKRTTVKKYEKQTAAERRGWSKFGPEAGRATGPHPDTTTLGENIIFRPQSGFKPGGVVEKSVEESKKEQALKTMAIKCRICQGDHFTTKCPFKDTMAPEGEAGAGLPDMDGDAGGDAPGGLGQTGSSYVPPHLRKGAAGGSGGERMGGKFERDDLATLRVTNVSLSLWDIVSSVTLLTTCRSASLRKRTSSEICSSASVVLPESSWPRIATPVVQRVSRLCRSLIAVMPERRWTSSMDLVTTI